MISHQEMGWSDAEIEKAISEGLIQRSMRRRNLRAKWVLRFDEIQRHFRLLRIMWERGTPGDGEGYSVKLAFGLWPRLFEVTREAVTDLRVSFLGLRVHYCRSYGGRFA